MNRPHIEIPADQLGDVRRISVTVESPNIVLTLWFHSSPGSTRILYNQDDYLVVAPGNPMVEVRDEGSHYVMGRDLQNFLRGQRQSLQSVTVNIVRGTTLSLQFGIFHSLNDGLATMNPTGKVINLRIQGATEFQMFSSIQDMLQYKDDRNGIVTLRFLNELNAETRRRAPHEMLKIRNLVLEASDIDDISTDLPYMDSGVLKELKLRRTPDEGDPTAIDLVHVAAMNQWRHLDKLVVNTFMVTTPLRQLQLQNKTDVDILLQSLTTEDMDYLTRRFLTAPHHNKFVIGFDYRRDYIEEQWAMYEDGAYFRIPNSDQVLSVTRNDHAYTFQRIERLPMGVELREFIL